MLSLVLFLPIKHQESGNAVAIALGHDVPPGNTYSQSLSASGEEPATHVGCRTWATGGFVTTLQIAKGADHQGVPSDLVDLAMSVRDGYPDMINALICDVRNIDNAGDARQHWDDALATAGLTPIALKHY